MPTKISGRHIARCMALQGLYAWVQSEAPLVQIVGDVCDHPFPLQGAEKVDKAYLQELLTQIEERHASLETMMLPYLDRAWRALDPVEQGILWIACYELCVRTEIPYKVIINEAILLAKQFGGPESHKFVNGVLDKTAKAIRPSETTPSKNIL